MPKVICNKTFGLDGTGQVVGSEIEITGNQFRVLSAMRFNSEAHGQNTPYVSLVETPDDEPVDEVVVAEEPATDPDESVEESPKPKPKRKARAKRKKETATNGD